MFESRLTGVEYATLQAFSSAAKHNARIAFELFGPTILEAHKRLFGYRVVSDDPLSDFLHGRIDELEPNVADWLARYILSNTYVSSGDEKGEDFFKSKVVNQSSLANGLIELSADAEKAVFECSACDAKSGFISLYINLDNQIKAFYQSNTDNPWISNTPGRFEFYGYINRKESFYALRELDEDEVIWPKDSDPLETDPPRRLAKGLTIEQRDKRILMLSKALRRVGVRTLKIEGAFSAFARNKYPVWDSVLLIDNFDSTHKKREILAKAKL